MKEKKIIPVVVPIAVIVLIVLVVSIVIGMQVFAPKFADKIEKIESSIQDVGGASSTNYMPILAANVNWDSLSNGEREGISRYAVKESIAKAEASGASSFSVVGLTSGDRKTAFLFTGDESIMLFAGEETTRITLDP